MKTIKQEQQPEQEYIVEFSDCQMSMIDAALDEVYRDMRNYEVGPKLTPKETCAILALMESSIKKIRDNFTSALEEELGRNKVKDMLYTSRLYSSIGHEHPFYDNPELGRVNDKFNHLKVKVVNKK